MSKLNAFLCLVFISFYLVATGQGLPKSSITLFELDQSSSTSLKNARYLTGFNADGYNNQPSFFDEHTIYISSDWNAKGQTDIVKLNLLREAILKVTDTDESEFSPTLMPDGQHFSTITVPPGKIGEQPQFLWQYPLDRTGSGNAVTYDFANVGYHNWLSENEVAIFLVGEPNQLILYNINNQVVTELDKNTGRCLKSDDKGQLIYVHKAALNIWYLKSYDPVTGKKKIIAETLRGSEDFGILNDGSIIMGRGSKLFRLSEIGGWKEFADLTQYKINKVTRMAVHGNKMAIVHATY